MTSSLSVSHCSDLGDFLQKAGELIHLEIEKWIPSQEPKKYLYDLVKDYPARGGKRFRSALVLLSCELFGGKISDAVVSAIAFEMFHNFALVHDDIEDDSLMRRGQETLHRIHGIPLALNTGDTMLGMVYEILLSNEKHLGLERTFRVMKHFNEMARFTFEGQALDIGWVRDDTFPTREEYQMMITRKTGWYSGRGPCQGGAMIAGASQEDLENIGKFGETIGIGFQARDDILNLVTESASEAPTASAGGYGKERGGDIAEGKRTLITIEMFDRLSESEGQRLHEILLKPREENTEDEIKWCIQKAESSGAIEAVILYCEDKAAAAKEALVKLPDHPARQMLEELVNYLAIQRYA